MIFGLKHGIYNIYINAAFCLLPIFEIFQDKLTWFHPLNKISSVQLSDLTSTEEKAEADSQEEAKTLEVEPGSGGGRSRSPEPDPEFVQNVLKETRQMLRERGTHNSFNNFRRRGRGKGGM